MKRFVMGLVAGSVAIGLLAGPVLAVATAIYSLTFTATEENGNTWEQTPMLVGIDNQWYADHGYITYDATETRVKQGGTETPHLVAYDKIAFVPPLIAPNSVTEFNYATGNTPVPMKIVTGVGGYVTTPDNRWLDFGRDFQFDVKGELLTGWSGYDIAQKTDAYRLYISDGGAGVTFETGGGGGSGVIWPLNIDLDGQLTSTLTDAYGYIYVATAYASDVSIVKVQASDMTEVDRVTWTTGSPIYQMAYDSFRGAIYCTIQNSGTIYEVTVADMVQTESHSLSGSYDFYHIVAGGDGYLYSDCEDGKVYKINDATYDLTDSWTSPEPYYYITGLAHDGIASLFVYGGISNLAFLYDVTTTGMDEFLHWDETGYHMGGSTAAIGDGYIYLPMYDESASEGMVGKWSTSAVSTLLDSFLSGQDRPISGCAYDSVTGDVFATEYIESATTNVYEIATSGMTQAAVATTAETWQDASTGIVAFGGKAYISHRYWPPPACVEQMAFGGGGEPVILTATDLSVDTEYLVSVRGDGANLKLFVNGTERDSVEYTSEIPTGEGNDIIWMSDATPWLSYISLVKDGTEVLRYEPVYMIADDDTLADMSYNGMAGIITWGATPEGISFSVGPLTPSNPAVPVVMGVGGAGGILPGIQAPPTMYTEGDTSKVPFGAAIDEILGVGGVPKMLWWFPFVFLLICILSLLIYEATTRGAGQTGVVQQGSILTMCIVVECLLILFGILGEANVSSLIPLFPAFLFPIPASAITLSVKHVGWG